MNEEERITYLDFCKYCKYCDNYAGECEHPSQEIGEDCPIEKMLSRFESNLRETLYKGEEIV